MTSNRAEELVSVYTSPIQFQAEMVRAMLADEEITATVENSQGPFPGLSAVPCEVFVAVEKEAVARQLIEEHEARLRERAAQEELEADDEDDEEEE